LGRPQPARRLIDIGPISNWNRPRRSTVMCLSLSVIQISDLDAAATRRYEILLVACGFDVSGGGPYGWRLRAGLPTLLPNSSPRAVHHDDLANREG